MKNIILSPTARIIAFLGLFVIIAIVGFWCLHILNSLEMTATSGARLYMLNLTNKKVVMIIAFRDFRDEEYFVSKEVLETAEVQVKTASNKIGKAIGADGGEVDVNYLVSELKPSDFDAIIFIGGAGTLTNLDNEDSYRVAKETISQNKILAAICISPVILAKAGVLNGKKATVWSSSFDKSAIEVLEDNGAVFQNEFVVIDGKIITGNGPTASKKFGEAIVGLLTKD